MPYVRYGHDIWSRQFVRGGMQNVINSAQRDDSHFRLGSLSTQVEIIDYSLNAFQLFQ